jgi:hypothetical protein
MIVTSSGITGTIADVARAILDEEVDWLRAEGKLEPRKSTDEKLKLTDETLAAAREFEKVSFAQRPHCISQC